MLRKRSEHGNVEADGWRTFEFIRKKFRKKF